MRGGTVLLVEDNPDDEMLALRALRQHDIVEPVVVARDGAEALDYLFGADPGGLPRPVPALVLLDLKLPKVSGLEVLKAIRSDPRTRRLPVVILTTSVEEQDVVSGYRLGANSYVCKPVDFEEFSQSVGRLGRYWLRLNQPAGSEATV
jgi:two-component system response regulator